MSKPSVPNLVLDALLDTFVHPGNIKKNFLDRKLLKHVEKRLEEKHYISFGFIQNSKYVLTVKIEPASQLLFGSVTGDKTDIAISVIYVMPIKDFLVRLHKTVLFLIVDKQVISSSITPKRQKLLYRANVGTYNVEEKKLTQLLFGTNISVSKEEKQKLTKLASIMRNPKYCLPEE